MPIIVSTNLTEKQETSSVGVSQKNYGNPSNPSQSAESKQGFNRVSFSVVSSNSTDDNPAPVLDKSLSALIRQISASQSIIQSEFIRRAYLSRSAANFLGLSSLETSAAPSTNLSPLHRLPHDIEEAMNQLALGLESERGLYELSDFLVSWMIDAPQEYHVVFAAYLQTMPIISSRILMASLDDAEFSTSNISLLNSVSLLLKSSDKRTAQTAASFLIRCGGSLGMSILNEVLSNQDLPCFELIQGIKNLVS